MITDRLYIGPRASHFSVILNDDRIVRWPRKARQVVVSEMPAVKYCRHNAANMHNEKKTHRKHDFIAISDL